MANRDDNGIAAPVYRPEDRLQPGIEERRSGGRYPCEAELQWTIFNMSPSHKGVLKNYGNNGLYMEVGEALNVGTYLLVTISQIKRPVPASPSVESIRMNAVAEVKWCRESRAGSETLFQVGLKYLRPI